MIHLEIPNIQKIEAIHFSAVKKYMESVTDKTDEVYTAIRLLPEFSSLPAKRTDWEWLKRFLLASVDTMKGWTVSHQDKLSFCFFKEVYNNKFANGYDKYVDDDLKYNAFKLFEMLNWRICPYCDDELIEIVDVKGVTRRTFDYDHFFPKGDKQYPALAMCLYNLIPSGKKCNTLKLVKDAKASPYSKDIENLSCFSLEYPIGSNLESVQSKDCKLHINVTGGMVENNSVMALEERYQAHLMDAYQLCKDKQQHPIEQLESMEKAGFGNVEDLIRSFFGVPYAEGKGRYPLQKMKYDLIGY